MGQQINSAYSISTKLTTTNLNVMTRHNITSPKVLQDEIHSDSRISTPFTDITNGISLFPTIY